LQNLIKENKLMAQMAKQESTRKPRIRRKREGKFTSRLISEEGMSDALRYLLEDSQGYMFIVNRSTVNPDTGESQDASIALSEKDPPLPEESLDPRLKRSRQIIIVLIQRDGGVAKINLTGRKWEIWITSATLREKLRTFNRKLLAGAHSRFVTVEAAILIGILPILSYALSWLVWSVSTPKGRAEIWSAKASSRSNSTILSPVWLQHFGNTALTLLPIFVLVGLGIGAIVLLGGGLRVWPEYLSRHSFQRAVYEMRSNLALPQNLNSPLFVSLAGAIVGAIVTYLLIRALG
jgi:hypothetical protein